MASVNNTIAAYLRAYWNTKRSLLLLLGVAAFLVTIPPRLIYSFPVLPPKPPLYHEINVTLPSPDPYPVKITNVPAPVLSAHSAIAVDVKSKAVIYMKNPDTQLSPASTTKMVTALVTLKEFPLDKVASVSTPIREGQTMDLYAGEQITIKNLLYGLLVQSGNDAAEELARQYPPGREAFVQRMNQEVQNLGLKQTHFKNPSGLDEAGHYSSVHDLAMIGAEVIANPQLAEIVNTRAITITDTSGLLVHNLKNINELLGVVPGMKGIKTGYTESAGQCLVGYTERNGHAVITAVVGSYDRFGETALLVDWIFKNHEWQEVNIPKE